MKQDYGKSQKGKGNGTPYNGVGKSKMGPANTGVGKRKTGKSYDSRGK